MFLHNVGQIQGVGHFADFSRLTETGVLIHSQASHVIPLRDVTCGFFFSVTSFSISICTMTAEPNAFEQYDKSCI